MSHIIRKLFLFFVLFSGVYAKAQTNNLTSSPYSLFGLGVMNDVNTGKTNALGKSGIALSNEYELNNINPASYSAIPKNSFFMDIGAKGENTYYENRDAGQKNSIMNVSNMAFGFGLSEDSGIGVTLLPYTNVGYKLEAATASIEGSPETYNSVVNGWGGLNLLQFNYGKKINSKLDLGVRLNWFFGEINENETVAIANDGLIITDDNHYGGMQVGIGATYKFSNRFTLGLIANSPVSLNGRRNRVYTRVSQGESIELENIENQSIDDFKLPLELGTGVKFSYKKFTFNADYKRSFWSDTNMTDNLGTFVDQDFIGMGAEYMADPEGRNYFQRVRYRAGLNYDNGYMEINGKRIKNAALTLGLGIPVHFKRNSFINLSYSYGQKGQVSNILVKENYHMFTVNLSLEDIWFVKIKYN